MQTDSIGKGRLAMGEKVAVNVTPEGVVLSHPLLEAWGDAPELEIEQVADALVIRLKTERTQVNDQIVSAMKAVGLIEDLPWTQPPVISGEERARLAEKLGRGRPLSELILEEREGYA
jgi:hypothetical protein